MSRNFLLPFAAALVLAGQAHAAGRSFSVTGFDKLRVEGPYTVDVRTGAGSSARASGDLRALDRLSVTVQGRTLIVRPDRSGWTGWPGERPGGEVTLSISTPALSSVALNGSGSVSIDRMAGSRIRSEEHTSELQSLMRISYAVLCLQKKQDQKIESNS